MVDTQAGSLLIYPAQVITRSSLMMVCKLSLFSEKIFNHTKFEAMTVYVVNAYDIHDFETFKQYPPKVGALLPRYGGKVLAMDTEPKVLEGTPRTMNVIVEFPSAEAVDGFYNDSEYQSFIHLRHNSTSNCTMIMVKQFVTPQ